VETTNAKVARLVNECAIIETAGGRRAVTIMGESKIGSFK
jgi:hypothetical protein